MMNKASASSRQRRKGNRNEDRRSVALSGIALLLWTNRRRRFHDGVKLKGNQQNERIFNRDRGSGGFERMSSAVVNVSLAVGVSVCVFLVAWWMVRKL